MIIRFSNNYLESLAKDENVKGKPKFDVHVISKFKKTLKILQRIPDIKSLGLLNSLNFERLKGNLRGKYSVRVDYHFRLIFTIENDQITITEILVIEDLTNHYQ